jgi:hypothetical protein
MTSDVLQHSVTKADVNPSPYYSSLSFNILQLPNQFTLPLLPELPYYWTHARDFVLSRTVLHEGEWSSAVSIAITKMASLSWDVESPVELRRKRAHEMFHTVNIGRGWVNFLAQHLRDYLTTDNGAFIEVVRATSGVGSKIMGLVHLDSRRCTRTGNPEIPVLYRDRLGGIHEMKAHQVITLVDMPDPGEMYNGVGLCATSRAYNAIRLQEVVDRYIFEKVAGLNPKTLEFIGGVSLRQIEDAIKSSEFDAKVKRQAIAYLGSVIVPFMESDSGKVSHETIDLAGLPDGFDYKVQLSTNRSRFANAIGLDPQELEPMTSRSLGQGAQSQVLDAKGKGKGLASWMQDFTHVNNTYVLDETTTFAFSEQDYKDDLLKAEIFNTRATAVGTLIDKGAINGLEGKQVMVDSKDLPEEFLPDDQTPTASLGDDEKAPTEDTEVTAEVQAMLNQPPVDFMAAFRRKPGATPVPPGQPQPQLQKKETISMDEAWQEVLPFQIQNWLTATGRTPKEALKELEALIAGEGVINGVQN